MNSKIKFTYDNRIYKTEIGSENKLQLYETKLSLKTKQKRIKIGDFNVNSKSPISWQILNYN